MYSVLQPSKDLLPESNVNVALTHPRKQPRRSVFHALHHHAVFAASCIVLESWHGDWLLEFNVNGDQ